ncbi:MAG: DNA repair protein RecO [Phycisphaerales bacterium]
MPPLRDHAIILRHWDYSETSQTVSLFTRDHGILRGLAKGCKRDRSTFSGGFESLTLGEIGASVRPNSELATLTDWDMREVFWGTRRSLAAHLAGLYAIDLLHHALRPLDPHPTLFDRSLACLRALEQERSIPATVLRFQWALAVELGVQPRMDEAVPSGHVGSPSRPEQAATPPTPQSTRTRRPRALLFSPTRGGLVQPDDDTRHDSPDPTPVGDLWKVRPETLDLLRALERDQPPPTAERSVVVRASRLIGAYLQVVLERELTTHEAYFARLARPVQSA